MKWLVSISFTSVQDVRHRSNKLILIEMSTSSIFHDDAQVPNLYFADQNGKMRKSEDFRQ